MAVLPTQYLIRACDGENMGRVRGRVICAGGPLNHSRRAKDSALIPEFEDFAGLDDKPASEPYIMKRVREKVEVEPMNVVAANGEKAGK